MAGAQFGIERRDRGDATQGAVGALQPSNRPLVVAKEFVGKGHDACQAVEPVGFIARQPSGAPATLQATGRQVKRSGEFL